MRIGRKWRELSESERRSFPSLPRVSEREEEEDKEGGDKRGGERERESEAIEREMLWFGVV